MAAIIPDAPAPITMISAARSVFFSFIFFHPSLRLTAAFPFRGVKLHTFPDNPEIRADVRGQDAVIQNAGIYTVIEFQNI